MSQVTKQAQSLSQTVQEIEEDICWLQRHSVNGVVPLKIQRELQDLQRTRASLVEKQAALA